MYEITWKGSRAMFKNFDLIDKENNGKVVGYVWDLEKPEYVVCIIHGLGELAGRYDRMNGYFGKANLAAVSMDLRGHGLSDGSRGHCAPRQLILQDVDALIEETQVRYPGVPIILYGHSLGGNIALDYKSRGRHNDVPVAFVISAPWLILKETPSPIMRKLVSVLSRVAPSLAIKSAIDEKILGHPDSVQPYNENPLVHDKISMLSAREGLEIGEAIVAGTHEDNGGSKGKPWLLMHGTDDRICDINGSKALYKRAPENCTFIPWEGLFHEIHNGNETSRGEEVILKMIQWIGELKG
jgi:acylglycerol lipase